MSGLARATGRLARLARPAAAALALPPLGLPQSQGTVMCRRFAGYVDPGPPRAPPPGDVGAPSYIAPRPTPSTAPGGGFSPTGQVQIGQPPAGSAPPAAAAQDAPPLKRVTAEDLNSEALKEMGIGGLDKELQDLFRRAFASRLVPPGVAERMGMGHVKGILMHGPPGTGKTLIARKIGRVLSGGREPQVVNGPELLARYVGQSEANMRALFDAAENEYKREGDNASLHVIIFDEIDALCKARGRDSDGPAVGDSMVNQLLTKLDGVSSVPNVLVIGLTNRRDLLDEALLRPGRLEVQMEIGLPDAGGREQILRIHTRTMAENDMLAADVDLGAVAAASRNFSGAEIAGLVRAAASHAYHRILNPGGHDAPETHGRHGRGLGMGKVEVRQADFEVALSEITPALGASGAVQGLNAFKRWYPHGMVWTGPQFDSIVAACRGLVAKVKGGQNSAPMVTALLEGPPGTGKSSFITEVFLQRIPRSARVLACTSTNKAIDSLVAKFEAVGVSEMVSVGSAERMGAASSRYLMSARISRDPVVARAEAILASVTNKREVAEESVAAAKKPKKPKKEKGGKENNRGFVKRTLEKIKADKKVAKKTPGIVRLMKIIGMDVPSPTNAEIVAAGNAYLEAPPDEEDAAAFDELAKARKALKKVEALEERVHAEVSRLRTKAARRVWRAARFVACTASSAVHVTRRICQDLEAANDPEQDGGSAAADPGGISFEYVILDEAGAMLEPDVLGTLIHGARAVLMVGDHFQLQPFSKWQSASARRYNVSLMERLLAGGREATMLTEQYRMHPDISAVVSRCFYKNRLTTAPVTAAARQHPVPACFVEAGGMEDRPRGATSWQNETEADAVVELVSACVIHAGHEQSAVNVITFYNGQRALIAGKLTAAGLRQVDVISVDAMQGREVDVVVLSCVRTSAHGLGFLADWRRLNVAISRAREQMVVVGSRYCLQSNQHWLRALQCMCSFPNTHSFKQTYFESVPAGWSTGNAVLRKTDASAGAYKSAPGAPPPPSPLDPHGAAELAAIQSIADDHIEERHPATAASIDGLAAGVETMRIAPTGTADTAWDDADASGAAAKAPLLSGSRQEVLDCWDDGPESPAAAHAEARVPQLPRAIPPQTGSHLASASANFASASIPSERATGRHSASEGPTGASQKNENDDWDDESEGGVKQSPMALALIAALEDAPSTAAGLHAALAGVAPRLAELCAHSRVKQAALLTEVAVLFEPEGQGELTSPMLRLVASSSLLRATKALYDEDVVEEEAIVEWVDNMKTAARLSDSAAHFTQRIKQMSPFVKWLQEAEEEDSE